MIPQNLVLTFVSFLFFQPLFAQNNYISGILPGNTLLQPQTGPTANCDTTFSFRTKSNFPGGITTDGVYIWSLDYNTPYIYAYTFTGVVADSIPHPAIASIAHTSGDWGGDIDFDGTNLLIFLEQYDSLYKVNPQTRQVVSRWKIAPCTTNCFGVAFDGTNIWVSDYHPAPKLYKLNASTGAVLSTVSLADTILPIKFINGSLYGIPPFQRELLKIETITGNILSAEPWCLNYASGFFNYNNHWWGASSQIQYGGTERIYKFGQLSSVEPEAEQAMLMTLFPNPTSGKLSVSFSNEVTGTIEVYNVFGKQVYREAVNRQQNAKLLLPCAAGIYSVRFNSGTEFLTKKLIVE